MKQLLLLMALCHCMASYSQKNVSMSLAPLGKLAMVKGVLVNEEGRTVSRPNRIPIDLDYSSEILQDYEGYSVGNDNFISWELRKITVSDTARLILIKRFKDGYYKYSSIQRGWTPHVSYSYYVIDESEVSNIFDSTKALVNGITCFNVLYHGELRYSTGDALKAMEYAIQKQILKKDPVDELISRSISLCLELRKVSNTTIRFMIYTMEQFSDLSPTIGGLIRFASDSIDLNKMWYETSILEFKKLFPVSFAKY